MNSEIKKINRCSSFSNEEKMLIANICARYKHILENKKADHISSEEKNKVWEKIAVEVNSAAVNTTHRTPDVLKRFYENRKREVRKIAAEEKKDIYATGGGQAMKVKKDACHDIILSMMNTKTVYGLDNPNGGDVEPPINSAIASPPSQDCNDIEIVYEATDSAHKEQSTRAWKKYIASDLRTPITSNLVNFEDEQDSVSCKIKENNTEETDTNTPQSKRKRHTYLTSRRRPTSPIKALTRSELAEKYDVLLDRRLDLALHQKKKIEEELVTIREERGLRFELFRLQIEVEKEKLKKFKGSALL